MSNMVSYGPVLTASVNRQDNKPIEIWSEKVMLQKIEYIHMNPVVAGFVDRPEFWRHSSATDFSGKLGLLKLEEL